MTFSLFFLYFITTTLLSVVFLTLMNAQRMQTGKDISNKAGLAVIASIFLGWTLIQTASDASVFPFNDFILGLYPFLIISAGLSMHAVEKDKIRRFWIYLMCSGLSVCFLPKDMFIFQGFLPLFFDRILTALLWSLFITLYTKMDKVENLTTSQTTAMCLAFSLFPLSALRYNTFVSSFFSYYPLIILSALIGFMFYKKRNPEVVLGKTGSAPLGYLMSFFLIFLASKGYWMAALIMPAYYYFEIIYSAVFQLIHRKNPQPLAFTFFVSYAIRHSLNPKGIMSLLMMVMLGFGLTAVLFNNSTQMMFAMSGMLFFYVIYRFLHWNQPKITYRKMYSDTKDVLKTIYQNMINTKNTIKDTWEKKNQK